MQKTEEMKKFEIDDSSMETVAGGYVEEQNEAVKINTECETANLGASEIMGSLKKDLEKMNYGQ